MSIPTYPQSNNLVDLSQDNHPNLCLPDRQVSLERRGEKVAVILISWKDYAKKFLADCATSLAKQTYPADLWQIFIVDNETTEENRNFIKATIPNVRLLTNKDNVGFAEGNNTAIKVALTEGFDYIVCLNLDVIVEPNWLEELVKVAVANPDAGAVQSLILLHPDVTKINSLGNQIHFLGFGFTTGYKKDIGEYLNASLNAGSIVPNVIIGAVEPVEKTVRICNKTPQPSAFVSTLRPPDYGASASEITYPSGSSVLYTRKALETVGLYSGYFFMYHEDLDLGWRMWLAGFKNVLAPKSIVYHKYEFSRSMKLFYFMERNRLIVLLRNYKLPTLLLILPAFIIMEIGECLFLWKQGGLKHKLRAYGYFFTKICWQRIWRERLDIAKYRRASDCDMLKRFSGAISNQEIDNVVLRYIANPMFGAYLWIIRLIVIW
jgi:hypothetical protein